MVTQAEKWSFRASLAEEEEMSELTLALLLWKTLN